MMTKVNQTNKREDVKRIEELCDDANKKLEDIICQLGYFSHLDRYVDCDEDHFAIVVPSIDYQGTNLVNDELTNNPYRTIFELQHLLQTMVSSFRYDTCVDTISDEFVQASVNFIDKSFKLYNTLLRLASDDTNDNRALWYSTNNKADAVLALCNELKYQFDSTRQRLNLSKDELNKFYQSVDWMNKLIQTVHQYNDKVNDFCQVTEDAPDFDNESLRWYGFAIDEHNSVVNLSRINC